MKSFILLFTVLFFSSCILSTAQTDSTKTEQYLKALEALQKKDTTSAVTLFKESAKKNNDAPSYFQLAKIYTASQSIQDYTKAYDYIKDAVDKDEKNVEYRLLKAFLMEELFYTGPFYKTFRTRETLLYEDIAKDNDNCEEAWFNLGRLYKEDYMKYMNSEYFDQIGDRVVLLNNIRMEPSAFYTNSPAQKARMRMRGSTSAWEMYDGFRNSLPKPALKYTRVANEVFVKSERAFLKSIDLTKNEKSFVELTELYILANQYDKGLELLKKIVSPGVDPVKFYLVSGMTNYLAGKIDLSENDYRKAFHAMSGEEREIYTNYSFKKLLRPETADSLSAKDKEFVEEYFNKYMQDNDPFLLTDYNERYLEHITRVIYTNLFLSVKRLNIDGWKSDRGEVVIRYGIPEQIRRMRAIFNGRGDQMETEVFFYPDKSFSFYDQTRRGRYVFNDPSIDGIFVSQSPESTLDSILVYRKNKPGGYVPKLMGPIFYTPFATYQFKSNVPSKTDIYISFIINPKDSSTLKDYFDSGYTAGLFLLDKNHNKITEKISNFPSLNSNMKTTINSIMINAAPREGNIAFEILRKKDNGALTYHDSFKVNNYSGNDLSMSDLVLCFDVGHSEFPSYIKRTNTYLLPNPSNFYASNMPLFIYYELNNLSLSSNNNTDFEQKITIQKKEEGGVVNSILSVVGLDKEGKKVSLTSNYQTQEKDPQMYLQLDMTKYEPGEYIITVSIKDNVTGNEVSSKTEIKWQ
ncbi:MAG: hypothetical protein CVV24_02090 [Ignavibacteriae bacterium HGW-Ignavibacteriae-3]|nr:MAG: hypothetical protein CVV24_02090 [Ignavibacteriae bacterium HGW-Ignavibacteriae-3]